MRDRKLFILIPFFVVISIHPSSSNSGLLILDKVRTFMVWQSEAPHFSVELNSPLKFFPATVFCIPSLGATATACDAACAFFFWSRGGLSNGYGNCTQIARVNKWDREEKNFLHN